MKPENKSTKIDPAEITPKDVYLSRRNFMKAAGVMAGGLTLSACVPANTPGPTPTVQMPSPTATVPVNNYRDEIGTPANSYYEITNYNNYYEFTVSPPNVAKLAEKFQTKPWDVDVYGLVKNPKTYSVEELVDLFQPEERVYRLRCVEGWSMVIPWVGFPLHKLLEQVEPTTEAKYVRFETVYRPEEMPGQKQGVFPWPYQEGLRMDEAMHDLTILATGMYGGQLPAQNGGGIRLVVPWKYGFKSIKAIVKIELVAEQPATMWNTIAANEYGFYSNVNPKVDHPRWSQATERRIGETFRRETFMFNGYEEQVAHLYEGMDLQINY